MYASVQILRIIVLVELPSSVIGHHLRELNGIFPASKFSSGVHLCHGVPVELSRCHALLLQPHGDGVPHFLQNEVHAELFQVDEHAVLRLGRLIVTGPLD